jgi:hypothetical protein
MEVVVSRLDVLTGCAVIAAASSVARLAVALVVFRHENRGWKDLDSALSEPSLNEPVIREHFGNGSIHGIRSLDQ